MSLECRLLLSTTATPVFSENFDGPIGSNGQVVYKADPIYAATGASPSGGDANGNSYFNGLVIPKDNATKFTSLGYGQTPRSLVPGKKNSQTLSVTNIGNIAAHGTVAFTVALASDAQGDNAQTLTAVSRVVRVLSGRSTSLRLSFVVPTALSAGSYFMLGSIAPASAINDTNSSNNEIVSAMPVGTT